jgi:hypothetical protein
MKEYKNKKEKIGKKKEKQTQRYEREYRKRTNFEQIE